MPALSPDLKRDFRTLLYAYTVVGTTRTAISLSNALRTTKHRNANIPSSKRSSLAAWHDSLTLSLAAFPVAFRRSFGLAQSWYPDSLGVPSFLASPSILLLPAEWRSQAALYACTSALTSMKRPPEIERWLPPVWTLNCLGNAILIYLFLTEKDSVQPSYERIVLNHSSGYIPRGKAKEDVVELIRNSNYPKITREAARSLEPRAHPLHTRYVCACMHPETPSCLENFISSMIHECRAIWQFFGVFGLAMVLLKRRAGVVKHPWAAYKQWVSYTVSSTLFAAGSITTAWGFVCFWQRLLPGTSLPRIRIMLGGIVSSLWILVLPPNRRKDISLYVARFAILNAYQTIKAKTSFNIPYGEVPLFALALTSLLQTKQSGNPVGGLTNLLLKDVAV